MTRRIPSGLQTLPEEWQRTKCEMGGGKHCHVEEEPPPLATAVVPPEVTAEVTAPTGPFFCNPEEAVA